jgi:hypothetical protein
MGKVSDRFQTPMWGTLISGTITGSKMIFNLKTAPFH